MTLVAQLFNRRSLNPYSVTKRLNEAVKGRQEKQIATT